jgi:hypothetical protein
MRGRVALRILCVIVVTLRSYKLSRNEQLYIVPATLPRISDAPFVHPEHCTPVLATHVMLTCEHVRDE